MSSSSWTAILGVALAISIAAHVARSVSPTAPRLPSGAPAETSSQPSTEPAPRDDRCQSELARCKSQAVALALGALDAQRGAPSEPRAPDEPAGDVPRVIGPAEQRAALCARAEANLKEEWLRGRDVLVPALKHSLDDPAEQDRNVRQTLDEMKSTLSLDDRAMASLERDYGDKRRALVADAARSLESDPPDVGSMLGQARKLFAEEDRMIGAAGGDEAARRWRAAQVEKRTTLMALLATLAGKEWDESVAW
jgi:hypothetical protein